MTSPLAYLPEAKALFMPAEWASHKATWMSWPFDDEMWFGKLEEVRREYSQFVRILTRFEPVHLFVRDEEAEQSARKFLADASQVHLHRCPLNDVWMRDNGPNFLLTSAKSGAEAPALSLVHWRFNAWGDKYDWDLDQHIPQWIAETFTIPRFVSPIIMEGGSLDLNGVGACLTTEQCLLTPTRNPELGKEKLELALRQYLGIDQLIWLKQGLEGDHTDGHIDTITRFVNENTVVSSVCLDSSDSNWAPMQENLEILRRTRLKDGRDLRVIELPLPELRYELEDGQRLPATYANFYIANGVVIVPQYQDPADGKALDVLRRVFPQHQVLGLSSSAIIRGGGSFHCLTQQQPQAK